MIVLDTSFLVACHNAADVHHEAARGAMQDLLGGRWGRGVLLEYVVIEVATVLLARVGLSPATRVVSILLEARELDFVPCSDLFRETLDTFRLQTGTRLSFVDAAIVAAARRLETSAIATFDRDFAVVPGITVVPA